MGIYSIIDNRAWHSLGIVTDEFKTYTAVTRKEINRIELDVENLGIKSMHSSYKVMNKWMGRIYIFKWSCMIEDYKTASNVTIKLQYKGKLSSTKEPQFFSSSSNPLVSLLNHDQELIEICRAIDFEKLELIYSKKDNTWNIEIWPNYGDFIWMLIPPVRYFRKPNAEEIHKTIKLVQRIRQVLNKGDIAQ